MHLVQQSSNNCGDSDNAYALSWAQQESDHRRLDGSAFPQRESGGIVGEDEWIGQPVREIGLCMEVFVVLEPCAVKVASTVLRGRRRSNALLLPDSTAPQTNVA